MADENDASADTPSQKILATLIRGRYYDHGGKVWDRDNADKTTLPVTPEQKAYLKKHAVIRETVRGEDYAIPRFKFSDEDTSTAPAQTDAEDEDGDETPAAPTRRRRGAAQA